MYKVGIFYSLLEERHPVLDRGFCLLLSILTVEKIEIQASKLKQYFTNLPKMWQSAISVKKSNL